MKIPSDLPRLKGFRYPSDVIVYAVWVYYRFVRRLIAQFDEPHGVIKDKRRYDIRRVHTFAASVANILGMRIRSWISVI